MTLAQQTLALFNGPRTISVRLAAHRSAPGAYRVIRGDPWKIPVKVTYVFADNSRLVTSGRGAAHKIEEFAQ